MKRPNLVGASPAFRNVLRTLHRFAAVDATILIRGETGTGKELAARTIHYVSPRCDGPFVPVNCGVLSDSLMESELFGHERGAFTDARRNYAGVVGEADGGTLFLDEVDTLTPRAQGALLRFLQEHTYRRVGGSGFLSADVRVIGATNADLPALVAAKKFREDLLFRLNVLEVVLPALRERPGDAVLLAQAHMARLREQYAKPDRKLTQDAQDLIASYGWPGNVRELESVLLRDFLSSDENDLQCSELRQKMQGSAALQLRPSLLAFNEAKARTVCSFERHYLTELVARTGGNLSEAARLAGKERSAFGKLLRKHGIRPAGQASAHDNAEAERP